MKEREPMAGGLGASEVMMRVGRRYALDGFRAHLLSPSRRCRRDPRRVEEKLDWLICSRWMTTSLVMSRRRRIRSSWPGRGCRDDIEVLYECDFVADDCGTSLAVRCGGIGEPLSQGNDGGDTSLFDPCLSCVLDDMAMAVSLLEGGSSQLALDMGSGFGASGRASLSFRRCMRARWASRVKKVS